MAYDMENIFSQILGGKIPCDKVFENDSCLAFNDITPAKKTHIIIIPKFKSISFDDFIVHAPAHLIKTFFMTVQQVASQQGIQETGYRLITNHGVDANQSVPHFHVHLLGGENVGPLVAGEKELR